jgi:hypothetical protein
MSKQTTYGKIYRSDIRARPRLPRGRIFTRGRVLTVRADGKKKCPRGRAYASARTQARPRGHRRVRFTSLPLTLPPTPSLALHGRAASAWNFNIPS